MNCNTMTVVLNTIIGKRQTICYSLWLYAINLQKSLPFENLACILRWQQEFFERALANVCINSKLPSYNYQTLELVIELLRVFLKDIFFHGTYRPHFEDSEFTYMYIDDAYPTHLFLSYPIMSSTWATMIAVCLIEIASGNLFSSCCNLQPVEMSPFNADLWWHLSMFVMYV